MTLYRYVLREFLRLVLITLFFTSFLFIFFDFAHKSTGFFGRYGFQPHLVILTYFYQLPFQIYQVLPIAALIGAVATLTILQRSGEVTAMRAIGMGPTQIMAPIAFGGAFFSLLSFFLGEWVVPQASQRARYVSEVLIRGERSTALPLETHWVRLGPHIFHFRHYEPATRHFEGIMLITVADDFTPSKVLYAASAVPTEEVDYWRLQQVRQVSYLISREVAYYEKLPERVMLLPIPTRSLMKSERRDPLEMSLTELRSVMRSGEAAGLNVQNYLIAWHLKVAFHFAALLLSLLALPLGYRSERSPETLRTLGMAFGMGLGYWVFLSAGKVLASVGLLPPWLAAWLANICILAVVIWQFYKVRRVQVS